jgi:hypothetical protein
MKFSSFLLPLGLGNLNDEGREEVESVGTLLAKERSTPVESECEKVTTCYFCGRPSPWVDHTRDIPKCLECSMSHFGTRRLGN